MKRNPQSAIRNSRSAIRDPKSAIRNPQSAISNPQSAIPNPQSELIIGTKHEREHVNTLRRYKANKITEKQAIEEIAQVHLAETPGYYTKLKKAGISGTPRPTTNSLGQPIAATAKGIANFWRWFGDSKVVDEQGRPLVVYHGTPNDFVIFNKSKTIGTRGVTEQIEGIYFTDNIEVAQWYAPNNDTRYIKEVYLSIQNPYISENIKTLKNEMGVSELKNIYKILVKKGYNGLLLDFGFQTLGNQKLYLAFSPNQIKSATGNDGSFDADDNSILSGVRDEKNTNEYKLAVKVQDILWERGIDLPFSVSNTDYGVSIYFTVYDNETYTQKLKIRISDHSVSNFNRLVNEQHENSKSDPVRIANDIELAMHPERYDKIQSGVSYYSKFDRSFITEPVVDGKAWVTSYNNEAPEKLIDGLNPNTTRVVSKEFIRKSKAGNKIYKVVLENLTEVIEVPVYKYVRKNTAFKAKKRKKTVEADIEKAKQAFQKKAQKLLVKTEEGYYKTPAGQLFATIEGATNNMWYELQKQKTASKVARLRKHETTPLGGGSLQSKSNSQSENSVSKDINKKQKITKRNKINSNGTPRPTTNSLGQPIAATAKGIANFWRWFGDSKVVDEQGRPLVVYHGTVLDKGQKPFTEFNIGELGIHFGNLEQANKRANRFSMIKSFDTGFIPYMYKVYLKIENPVYSWSDTRNWSNSNELKRVLHGNGSLSNDESEKINWNMDQDDIRQELIDFGYDGVKYRNSYEGIGDSYIVFSNNQIKSATGNDGSFDADDNSILSGVGDEKTTQFVSTIQSDIANGVKHNKTTVEKLAATYGITDKNNVKEYTELAIVQQARHLAHETGKTLRQKFDNIVQLYRNQVNLSHRTSRSILLQQYSTPAPIGYLMGVYVMAAHKLGSVKRGGRFTKNHFAVISKKYNNNYTPEPEKTQYLTPPRYFEPSAGNGLLTVAMDPQLFTVNEIDDVRRANLLTQNFASVTAINASSPQIYESQRHAYDGVVTNPPFDRLNEPVKMGGFLLDELDHVMAAYALETMKDNGRCAIIVGGHINYDAATGRIKQKGEKGGNRNFYNFLYRNYKVDDILYINGDLYSRQGTSFDVRLILISGRKPKPEGFAPKQTPEMNQIINTWDEFFNRVTGNLSQSEIPNPQSAIQNQQSEMLDPISLEFEALELELQLLNL